MTDFQGVLVFRFYMSAIGANLQMGKILVICCIL